MLKLPYTNTGYRTSPRKVTGLAKTFPMALFYPAFLSIIIKAGIRVKRNRYSRTEWIRSSLGVVTSLERIGVRLEITGFEHLEQLDTPCVVVGNHMSTLETVILPGLIQPIKDVTFIVKNTLLNYPIFKDILSHLQPIVVGRVNPRQDFKIVMQEGLDRLKQGISVIVFPQTTRYLTFAPSQFNTLGIKLAKRANVPVIPLALLTDAWRNGKYFKDLGPIDPAKKVFIAFGHPIWIEGRGTDEHLAVTQFIQHKLAQWQQPKTNC
jgi:1-acyl-sn-glycerol-3-phosphate acyltransferase